MSLTLIDNIYKKWKDIKEYVDSRIQFSSIIDKEVTDSDLSALDGKINKKQDKLKAGDNIIIENNVISSKVSIVTIDQTSGSTIETSIDPNKMYLFGEKTDITITLNTGEIGIVNEYMFQFESGNVATTLNVPNTVVWLKEPDIQTNKIYQVSIENNLGIIGEWSNE